MYPGTLMYCRPCTIRVFLMYRTYEGPLYSHKRTPSKGPSYVLCSAANHPGASPSPAHIHMRKPIKVPSYVPCSATNPSGACPKPRPHAQS